MSNDVGELESPKAQVWQGERIETDGKAIVLWLWPGDQATTVYVEAP